MEVLPSGPGNIKNQVQEQNKIILPCSILCIGIVVFKLLIFVAYSIFKLAYFCSWNDNNK